MIRAAGRSRLLELRRDVAAARVGRELLDRRREALLRAVVERGPRVAELRREAAAHLSAARVAIDAAEIAQGRMALDAAVLAQPAAGLLEVRERRVAGVPLPELRLTHGSFLARYGPLSGSPLLEAAGSAFSGALDGLIALAAEEAAVRRLRRAVRRTVRRLNALDKRVIPKLAADIAEMTIRLEEEERDDAVRGLQWRRATGIRTARSQSRERRGRSAG